jgi:hypothetical protein
MDTEPVLALEPLQRNSQGETTDTPAPAQSISRSSLWYSRGIVSHEIEFSFLDNSHDTHTCDVGHRRSEGDVA